MRERGKYQIQCMKSRSSTGVGMKVDLEYNIETMRITDDDPEGTGSSAGYHKPQPSPTDLMTRMKPTPYTDISQLSDNSEPLTKKIVANVQGSKLNALLNSLKK
jgi:hypothetical protein